MLIALSDGNYLSLSVLSSARLILVVAAMNTMLRGILKSLERVLWCSVVMGIAGKAKMALTTKEPSLS